jgi:hypothetical protein
VRQLAREVTRIASTRRYVTSPRRRRAARGSARQPNPDPISPVAGSTGAVFDTADGLSELVACVSMRRPLPLPQPAIASVVKTIGAT